MAAAEARAAWQRMANRCFVQEDAKRAPVLACCPSSSSTLKPQSDMEPGDFPNVQDHPSEGFIPLKWDSSNSNLDTKWWLQGQPNVAYQKDFTHEQLIASEAELEVLRDGVVQKAPKFGGSHPSSEEEYVHIDSNKNSGSYLDPLELAPVTCMMHDEKSKINQLKAVGTHRKQVPEEFKDIGDYWCGNQELESLNPGLFSEPSKKVCSDLDSPWMIANNTEPWWRVVDKNELVSLVAQKSLELIENCDLPQPHTMHVSRGPFNCSESSDNGGIFSSSLDQKMNIVLPKTGDCSQGTCTSGSADSNQTKYCESGNLTYDSERLFSNNGYAGANKEPTDPCHLSKSEPSKAQLLEALCHSQTRAREAEKAAQKAYTENEHTIKLLFIQASHLFAYKQWFKLLQLEALCHQLKNKDQSISTLFPLVLPWMPYKGRQLRKHQRKAAEQKQGALKCDISKYAVAFALGLGLGLAGAGLFLGWTMGFVLPSF